MHTFDTFALLHGHQPPPLRHLMHKMLRAQAYAAHTRTYLGTHMHTSKISVVHLTLDGINGK